MDSLINKVSESNPLARLIQKDNFIGWVYSINYKSAQVITNDEWKHRAKGIPHNCFLLATSINPEKFSETNEIDREVVLLRVVGTSKLPQDDDVVRTKIDSYQNQTQVYLSDSTKDYDSITRNRIQFGGLECRVLGTFYMKNNSLQLGSDIESFSVSMRMSVFIPKAEALGTIVNYIDPVRKENAKEEFKLLGIKKSVLPFKIGTVRYTSTDRLHRTNEEDKVSYFISPADFLARRTAVLGMTRTGKSNMIKQTVSVVKKISSDCDIKIGQLIYDINGEYANANKQDKGSISELYASECVRYRMIPGDGFVPILNNFYEQLQEGHGVIVDVIKSASGSSSAEDIKQFTGLSFDEPEEFNEKQKWKRKIALYKTLLFAAGYTPSNNYTVKFEANEKVRSVVDASIDPKDGLTLQQAKEWFTKLRTLRGNSDVDKWITEECKCLLNMLCQKNESNSFINGYRVISVAKGYHTPARNAEVAGEIYDHLVQGKIVIIDLSVGNAELRDKISKKIAAHVFNSSMQKFTEGQVPPNIVIYIEEAHNLIGKGTELTDTWPRLAKEGAKYKIALVYATQEVSSVHPNILANTENWFVSHLNSSKEINELAKFYDFGDFSESLIRSQDVGFARVKSLSSPFVVPVQIDKFDPAVIKGGN